MKYLLPHRFKKIGAIVAPLGFAIWVGMQWGYLTQALIAIFGEAGEPFFRTINIVVAVISFFSFVAGFYFVTFSKEKVEDELVQKTRLESFQFAAFVQLILTLIGFLMMLFLGEPEEAGMMLFFTLLLLVFWLCFTIRFNYLMHVVLNRGSRA